MRIPLIHQGEGNTGLQERYANIEREREDINRMLALATSTETEQERRRRQLIGRRSPAGDEQRLRMIPVVAPGVAGAIPQTKPLEEIIRKENARERDTQTTRPPMRTGFDACLGPKRALIQLLRARDGDNCYLCATDLNTTRIVIEHIIPSSREGTNDAHNLALACWMCNSTKADKYVSITIHYRFPIYHAEEYVRPPLLQFDSRP